MPPPTPPTPNPTAQQNGHVRKRTAPVVPAIPLALSKPKPTKAQPKPEPEARGGAETATPTGNPPEPVHADENVRPVSNGTGSQDRQGNGTQTPEDVRHAAQQPDTPGSGPASATNGATPEAVIDHTSRPSTGSTSGDATATNTPELARKPVDRFDMRHIRTELPPAFIPSAEQHTPRSNGSSQSTRPPTMPPHAHPSHPSTSSIVFGGRDSSASSPAPPQSAGSAYNPPPFSAFGGASVPPFQPSGHSHHISEPPHGPRGFQHGFQQPAAAWNARPGYGPSQAGPQQPHAHMPFRYPPREPFTPIDSPHVNGKVSRSASQASSAADQPRSAQPLQSHGPDPAQEPRSAYPLPPHVRPFQQQPPPPPQGPSPDITWQMDNAEALRAHVLSQFANATSTDCSIHFFDGLDGARQTFSGHRLILSRSPSLAHLLSTGTRAPDTGSTDVEAHLSGRYIKLGTLNEALKYLYGGPLLQPDPQRPTSSAGERTAINAERMENALSYVAAGAWLKMPVIAARGVEVAGSLLHWDTIPSALAFALDGGLSQVWTIDDGSEDPFSASSSDDSLARSEITGAPTYDPYSTALLNRVIDFTIHVFPQNFYLDTTAPQLETCPRLPQGPKPKTHESRSSTSDPRLSTIRFGDIPMGPSFTTTLISSILLSLPFQLLKAILEHWIFASRLGADTAASIMRQIVNEREKRRVKAQQARVGSGRGTEGNLGWEEFVEPDGRLRVGSRLARRRRGMDTPMSSGPE